MTDERAAGAAQGEPDPFMVLQRREPGIVAEPGTQRGEAEVEAGEIVGVERAGLPQELVGRAAEADVEAGAVSHGGAGDPRLGVEEAAEADPARGPEIGVARDLDGGGDMQRAGLRDVDRDLVDGGLGDGRGLGELGVELLQAREGRGGEQGRRVRAAGVRELAEVREVGDRGLIAGRRERVVEGEAQPGLEPEVAAQGLSQGARGRHAGAQGLHACVAEAEHGAHAHPLVGGREREGEVLDLGAAPVQEGLAAERLQERGAAPGRDGEAGALTEAVADDLPQREPRPGTGAEEDPERVLALGAQQDARGPRGGLAGRPPQRGRHLVGRRRVRDDHRAHVVLLGAEGDEDAADLPGVGVGPVEVRPRGAEAVEELGERAAQDLDVGGRDQDLVP